MANEKLWKAIEGMGAYWAGRGPEWQYYQDRARMEAEELEQERRRQHTIQQAQLGRLGLQHMDAGRFDQVFETLNKSLVLAQQMGDPQAVRVADERLNWLNGMEVGKLRDDFEMDDLAAVNQKILEPSEAMKLDALRKQERVKKEVAQEFAGTDTDDYTKRYSAGQKFGLQDDALRIFTLTGKLPEEGGGMSRKDILAGEKGMRDSFIKLTSSFADINDAYGRIKASANNPSAAGDLALIFNYMKVLDPGSTVREGEFANAQNAAGIPNRVRAMYNNVMRGERMTTEQRNDFVSRAGGLYDEAMRNFDLRRKVWSEMAQTNEYNPANVTPDRALYRDSRAPMPPWIAQSEYANTAQLGADGNWYVRKQVDGETKTYRIEQD